MAQRAFFIRIISLLDKAVYLSQVIAWAMQVPGVESVSIDDTPPRPNLFRRWGQASDGEIDRGFIPIHRLEIARLGQRSERN
jgi:hypothetical protein